MTVGIPNDYFEKVWRSNPVAAGQEAKPPDQAALEKIRTEESLKIQKHVAALLPPAKSVPDLTNWSPSPVSRASSRPTFPCPAVARNRLLACRPLEHARLDRLGAGEPDDVAVDGSRRSWRSGSSDRCRLRVAAETATQEKESIETVAARRLQRFSGGGPSLRDELSELVKEDPDAAANILRSWIGHTN